MMGILQHIRPIYRKEMMISGRTARLTLIVMSFHIILLVVGVLQLQLMVQSSRYYGEMSYASLLHMYALIGVFEGAFLLILVPVLTAGSIAGERERQTLDLLLCTRLRPIEIVIGKLVSCLSTVFVIIITSLPFLALVYIYGGVKLEDLGLLFACLFVTAVYVGSISMFFSARMKRTTQATVLSYVSVIVLVAGTYLFLLGLERVFLLLTPQRSGYNQISLETWKYLLLLNPAVTFYGMFARQLGGLSLLQFGNWDLWEFLPAEFASPVWFWCSCLVQLVIAAVFLWLAAECISPLKPERKRRMRKGKKNENEINENETNG